MQPNRRQFLKSLVQSAAGLAVLMMVPRMNMMIYLWPDPVFSPPALLQIPL